MTLRFFRSLQAKVALGTLLVSLAPLAIAAFFALRTADAVIASIVTSQLENVAAEKQALLERWIAERRADVEVIAGSSVAESLDPRQLAPYLKLVHDQYAVYRRFVVAGPDGTVVFDTAGPPGAACAAEPWFAAGAAGERYMSEVRLAADGAESVFLLVAPIGPGGVDVPGGKPRGVLCASVEMRAILQNVLRVSLGQTGECYLVDEKGTFLVHKDPGRVLRDNIAASESFTNVFKTDRPPRPYTDYRRIAVLGASRRIPGTQWFLVVEQDEDEAFESAHRLRAEMTVVGAAAAAAAVGLSVLLGYYVTAMQEHRARLEHRVGATERELERTGARLQHTLQAAARSEHLAAMGRLASGVAHEVRTPLTSLKLYLQSVQEDFTVSPEHAEDYDVAMRQVDRIEKTIDHFLRFARPQAPVMAAVDLKRLVDDAVLIVRPRANQQGVAVAVDVAPGLPAVTGDARQLGEALVNLLVNALEEMPGGGRLAVGARWEPAAGRPGAARVALEVADTGPGVREPDLEKIFEPFFTTKASGSGLGLSIVRATVERHGGAVRVRTGPGAGTAFTMLLPPAEPVEE